MNKREFILLRPALGGRSRIELFDEVQLERYQKHPQELKSYIQVALKDCLI